jgi:hypothetical protein
MSQSMKLAVRSGPLDTPTLMVSYASDSSCYDDPSCPNHVLLLRSAIANAGGLWFAFSVSSEGFRDSQLRLVCISRTIEVLEKGCFSQAAIAFVAFESLAWFDARAAEAPDNSRFQRLREEIVGCEAPSGLTRIEDWAFCGCSSLRSIWIPSSVSELPVTALVDAGICLIQVAEGNRHFRVSDHFLLSFDGKFLIRYFGQDSTVRLPREIEVIGSYAFYRHPGLSSIEFPGDSQLRRIEACAFAGCESLHSMCVPLLLEVMHIWAFGGGGIEEWHVTPGNRHFQTTDFCRHALFPVAEWNMPGGTCVPPTESWR